MLPVPSKETPPIVLAVSRAVAVAALPEVSWLPVALTPGRLMLPEPSKETPPIVLAFARAVAVSALPVTSPVMLPTNPPEAVTTPETAAVAIEMSSLRLTVTPLLAAAEVRFVPPAIVNVSERRLISSEPVSPATVNPLPTAAVVADVTRPLASIAITGISVVEP